ncbi:MAG: hypothetical protein HOP07_06595 [Bacteriovoracaceae bacterium]|nr:hypothetical protein [Bacteriovoracaceae bacterium]
MNMQKFKLKDVATFINGKAFKSTEWSDNGIPIIRIQNLTKQESKFNYFKGSCEERYLVKNGDILISWSGTLGVFEWSKGDAWLNQHIFKVVFNKENLDKDYFKILIDTKMQEMLSYVHGSTMKHITKSDFEEIVIELPNIIEQRNMAQVSKKANLILNKRRQVFTKIDQLTQSLFLDMFGDPMINPKGWPVVKLEDVVSEIESGWSPVCQKEKAKAGEWGVLKLSSVSSGFYRDSESKALLPEVAAVEKIEVKAGDLLLARKNVMELVGMSVFVFETQEKLMLPDLIFRINLKNNSGFTKEFLWQMFKTAAYLQYIQSFAGGTSGSMPNISKTNLMKLKLVSPPFEIQKKFSDCVHAIYEQKKLQKDSIAKLEFLQQSLMNKFFGK